MLHGFLLLDKEKGLNSFKLVMALRRLSNQKRVGFAGTLDPLATGLMVMALGEYTKLLPYLEAKDKRYRVKILFGKKSDTYDAEGEISDVPIKRGIPARGEIEKLITDEFLGKISQLPPRFSAIQIDGKRAYQMARDGEDFQMKPRQVEIFSIAVRSYDFPYLELDVHCSSGTYIRSLANDLGERLGCGGLVQELRRTSVGDLGIETGKTANLCKKLEQLEPGNLVKNFVDPKVIFDGMKQVELTQIEYDVLAHGNFVGDRWGVGDLPAMAFLDGQIVGVLEGVKRSQAGDNGGEELKFSRKLNIF